MKSIATLTMNPTIDVSYDVPRVQHTHKMRTDNEWYAPGGGGINVARVFVRLGGNARCYYLSGGATGPALDGLIDRHQLVRTRIPIAGPTRVASAVLERETGKEFRFTPRGPTISESEWRECLEQLAQADCGIMVMSGSLSPGVPEDFYARVTELLRPRGIQLVLDSSGAALAHGIDAGSLMLVKPSQGELQHYVGRTLDTPGEIGREAMRIVEAGKARLVAVTMGHEGAVLAREAGPVFLPALKIEAASAVGAGDSFVAGMVFALHMGKDELEAFRHGIAAGSAAVLRAGTGLAHPADIDRLLERVEPL
ncbi:1-phosphofructokinase family hexose kinase [Novosphingobium mangrovi (ex Huang et al. 2023)]|uniref:Phosphofructokinase n=1 Tax=Novosphingobium mangrovi (ex Huang et al. 2023) TaxID=2976432 RepID=A0ABT2I4R8_9SPHN|nr:1-phosphofructokinase family hexose kinase [Novosphingobium mangrovi (ex Huang et al. 2023)]MCT2399804.1 1-phosphofructokinase family hexose kinase [Novosphingobium mangrovi (ex Huang et al. 2023)]